MPTAWIKGHFISSIISFTRLIKENNIKGHWTRMPINNILFYPYTSSMRVQISNLTMRRVLKRHRFLFCLSLRNTKHTFDPGCLILIFIAQLLLFIHWKRNATFHKLKLLLTSKLAEWAGETISPFSFLT